MKKTRKKPWWSGWRGNSPNKKQRKTMRKRCGKKCFLGPNLSFPICAKGTCRRNKRGIMSAYIRAKQWGKPKSFYKNYWGKPRMKRKVYTRVVKKARKLMGRKKGGRRTKRRRGRRGGVPVPVVLPIPADDMWDHVSHELKVGMLREKINKIIQTRGSWQLEGNIAATEQEGGGRKRSQRGGVKGTIVFLDPGRGYGHIIPDDTPTERFLFHFTSANLGRYKPSVGDKVEFNVNRSRIPRRAKDVVKLQEPEPMEIDFDQEAQEACKNKQKEKCIKYFKKLGLSQDDAELVIKPFLSGKTRLAELEQKLQALVREHIDEGGGGGNQGGGGRKRRRRTRRKRAGMNPQGNSGAPNLQEMERKNQNNENTVEIHNVEDQIGKSMQKQAWKAGVIEDDNFGNEGDGPPKLKRRHTRGGMKLKAKKKKTTTKKETEKLKKKGYYPTIKKGMKVWIKKKPYENPETVIPYENPETVENIDNFFN